MNNMELEVSSDNLVSQALEILALGYGLTPDVIRVCLGEDEELMESFNAIVDLGIYNLARV